MIQGWLKILLTTSVCRKYESNPTLENKTVKNELLCSLGNDGNDDKKKGKRED